MHANTPVHEQQRLDVLDAMRGFALIGVLAANLLTFSGVVFQDEAHRAATALPRLDVAVRWLQVIVVEGKFYGLFSLLFGIGVAMFLDRSGDANGPRRFQRRMLVLAGIGVLHSILWLGDVLLLYATLGLMLLSLRGWNARRLLELGLICFGLAAAWRIALPWVTVALEPSLTRLSPSDSPDLTYARYFQAIADGSVGAMVRTNLQLLVLDRWPGLLASGRAFQVFGLFVLGFAAGRGTLVTDLPTHAPLLRRLAGWGLGIGLPANLLFAVGRFHPESIAAVIPPLAESLGVLAFTISYASCFALGYAAAAPWLAQQFRPLGRTALSCYLTQTVVGLFGFSGLGLGGFRVIGAAAATALVVPIIVAQWVLATWWLNRFRFGPAEWLWRSLTYGSRQPMWR